MAFHYADPQQGFGIGHAQPVAYAALSQVAQDSTLSFDFIPAPNPGTNSGRVSHEVGLMTAANGFALSSCCTSLDYAWNIPIKGLGVSLSRSSYAYTNSTIALFKYDGVYPTVLNSISLPFQFDVGTTYHFEMSIANDTLSVSVSNGVQTTSITAPLSGFTLLADQVFALDDQGGNDGLSFDNFLVSKPAQIPTSKDDCKKDRWMTLVRPDGSSFKNQGDCVSFTETGK